MDKLEYLNLKKYIKTLCLDDIKDLCNNVGLTEYEYQLLYNLNRDNGRIMTSLMLNICETKYTMDMKKCLEKVNNYLKRTGI